MLSISPSPLPAHSHAPSTERSCLWMKKHPGACRAGEKRVQWLRPRKFALGSSLHSSLRSCHHAQRLLPRRLLCSTARCGKLFIEILTSTGSLFRFLPTSDAETSLSVPVSRRWLEADWKAAASWESLSVRLQRPSLTQEMGLDILSGEGRKASASESGRRRRQQTAGHGCSKLQGPSPGSLPGP